MAIQSPCIHSIFPTPVYIAKRDSDSISEEEKVEVEKIIQQGELKNLGNSSSANSYIFDSNLKNIKQFGFQNSKFTIFQTRFYRVVFYTEIEKTCIDVLILISREFYAAVR